MTAASLPQPWQDGKMWRGSWKTASTPAQRPCDLSPQLDSGQGHVCLIFFVS